LNIGQEDRQLDVRWLELLPKIIGGIAERAMISVHAGLQQRTVWNTTSQSLLFSQK
jgi:hypothetical protein